MLGEIGQSETRLVFERCQGRIVESGDEDIVNEVAHRLAAAAMRKADLCDMNAIAHFAPRT